MITPLMFWVFAVIGAVLAVYVFIDNQNRVFGHVFAAVVATVLFFLLGVNLMGGNVGEEFPVSVNETVNNTTTLFTYSTVTVAMQDSGISWFFIFLGVVMLIVTIMASLEIAGEVVGRSGLSTDDGWDDE